MINMQLKKFREINNFTQKDIAKILNMSITGYASLEQGKAEPSIYIIKSLCIYYNITADELLEIETEKQRQEFFNDFFNRENIDKD